VRGARLRERLAALLDVGVDLAAMDDDEFEGLCRDIARRRKKRDAEYGGLRGADRKARIRTSLLAEVKALAMQTLKSGNSTWWWGGRFRSKKAWEHVAKHLTPELRRLFKRKRVSWRTVRHYTAKEVKGWHIEEARRDRGGEMAGSFGLLRHIE
jgi:hypothetical protein